MCPYAIKGCPATSLDLDPELNSSKVWGWSGQSLFIVIKLAARSPHPAPGPIVQMLYKYIVTDTPCPEEFSLNRQDR